MKRFLLTREAERDLDQIKHFLLTETGPRVTRRVLQKLHLAMIFLAREPAAGHTREDLTDRPVKFWNVYSYLLVYNPTTKPLVILRVLHGSRDVEGVLGR